LVEIPPKMSVSGFMGYLKGKSSLMLYEQFGDLKFKYRNREFWVTGSFKPSGLFPPALQK
ncbi:transposase, partial [Escherichia coli]